MDLLWDVSGKAFVLLCELRLSNQSDDSDAKTCGDSGFEDTCEAATVQGFMCEAI